MSSPAKKVFVFGLQNHEEFPEKLGVPLDEAGERGQQRNQVDFLGLQDLQYGLMISPARETPRSARFLIEGLRAERGRYRELDRERQKTKGPG